MEHYYTIKAFHIIFVISWYTAILYMGRLFIYYMEAEEKPEVERTILQKQYVLLQKRLWFVISFPAMILATIFGAIMLYMNPSLLKEGWMHFKLGILFILFVYHFYCTRLYKLFKQGIKRHSEKFLRFWNEFATLLLFAIVFPAVTKGFDFYKSIIGFFVIVTLLTLGIKFYKKRRIDS